MFFFSIWIYMVYMVYFGVRWLVISHHSTAPQAGAPCYLSWLMSRFHCSCTGHLVMSKILARMFQFAFSIPSCQSNESKIFHYQWFGMVFLTKTLSKCSSSFSRVFSYIRWQNRTHPKFFSTGRGKPYSTRAKESGSTSKVAPVFFGGEINRENKTHLRKKPGFCVCLF